MAMGKRETMEVIIGVFAAWGIVCAFQHKDAFLHNFLPVGITSAAALIISGLVADRLGWSSRWERAVKGSLLAGVVALVVWVGLRAVL